MEHLKLGKLHYLSGEGHWVGELLESREIYIEGNSDGLDPACEALAVRELEDLDGLVKRIEDFLATVSEPYLDQWASREWELARFIFASPEVQAAFIAEYYLARDDYVVWQVRVENGKPVKIDRRP